jgi:hypothetical protein
MTTTTVPLSYSIAGAVQATGLSKSHLERAVRSGELKARKSSKDSEGEPKGKYVILTRDLEAYLEGLVDA